MKRSRKEDLSEHLLNVDDSILENAYEVDSAEKLKKYMKEKKKSVKPPFYSTPAFRKKMTAAACCLLVIGILFAIPALNPQTPPVTPPPEEAVDYTQFFISPAAEKADVDWRDAYTEEYKAFLEKLELFAAKLTQKVYAYSDKKTNIAVSPVSVYMALALAVECTNGDTRNELLDAVGVTYGEVASFTKILYAFSNEKFWSGIPYAKAEDSAFVELANSIWMDDNVTLTDTGIGSLVNDYNCDLFHVDFQDSKASKAIEAYIKDKTHGIIDGAIDVSPETLITLINTFYLKEVWKHNGTDLELTEQEYGFQNADGSLTQTKLLEGLYFSGKAYEGEGYTSFYTTTATGFKVKFILPKDGYTLEEVFTAENIYRINNISDYKGSDYENKLLHSTRVLFPEYEASYEGDLTKILQNEFGITSAFDPERSDFSGITEEDLVLESVVHKCELTVTKEGIVGGATTDAYYGDGSSNWKEVYHDYVVDRAFGFVIADSYGSILFSGTVNFVAQ